ncbi:multidrug transporter [Vibrio mediterranei]|uniref:multidrug transporter n=1 Tax=Vibrio mediterranei TaxID=689 RepID=UPI001EFE1C25|nr:multidrug transporter [Vibrio mediterranei]MCG9629051.1 multidrug transporter [Vibrio mediterranei]
MRNSLKVSTIAFAIMSVFIGKAMAANTIGAEYTEPASKFFEDSTISGNLNFFMRKRDRVGSVSDSGEDGAYDTNLDHGSIFANLGFNSGYIGGIVGTDLVIYSTFDMWQNGSADHEMNFWNVNNPFDKQGKTKQCTNVWTDCNENGVSYATASLKFRFGENIKASLGYIQPSVPSALGVNWSYAPGTYRGAQIGGKFDNLELGFIYADEYKAPWFKKTYRLQTTAGEDAGEVYSVGARYTLSNGIVFDAGYAGLTVGNRKNFHLKVKGSTTGGFNWSPQVYVVSDDEQYDSTAFQAAFISSKSIGQYTFRADSTYTKANAKNDGKGTVGNFSYRLTSQYGGSNGAYDIWWNNRSDFNHDGEIAGFLSVSRDFSDVGGNGFSAGISTAGGFGSTTSATRKSGAPVDDLTEYAYSLFATYAIQKGALTDANISFYWTQYINPTNASNWTPYSNLFQDEKDFKLSLTIPFNVK